MKIRARGLCGRRHRHPGAASPAPSCIILLLYNTSDWSQPGVEGPASGAKKGDGVANRQRISEGFEWWGELVVRRRWLVISVMLMVAAGLATQLPRLEIDNSVEAFLHEDDPYLIHYNEFRDHFGRDDVTVIVIRPPEIFDLDFLEKLRALHQDLENEVPYLDEVTSLVNARSTRGEGDELIIEDLLEEWPRDQADLAALREQVFANPLYLDTLVSRDGRLTTVTLEPVVYSPAGSQTEALAGFDEAGEAEPAAASKPRYLTDLESIEMVQAVREVMLRYRSPELEMHLAGTSVVEERLEVEMQSDLEIFLGLSMLAIVAVLLAVFRRVSGVVLPLLTVALSLAATMGAMALFGISLSLTTEILPSFLLTIGVCYSVHILVVFFQALDRGAERGDAIRHALGHSGLAVMMTGLTTAGGLASFAWADVKPVAQLGIVGPLGVMLAVVFALVLLPALLAVVPLRGRGRAQREKSPLLTGLVVACGRLSARRPWLVLGVSALLLALAAAGASQLRFANDYMLWFPEGEPLVEATELIDRELRGAVTLEAIVETGEENGLHAPELLRRLDALAAANASVRHGEIFIGKTISLADILKETHQALNENRREFYDIPNDRLLVAQELLLFENGGADDLENLVDSQFSRARISMKIPWADWVLYPAFLEEMREHLAGVLGEGVRFHLTGFCTIMARAATSFITTMAQSYTLALIIITPLMIFLLGSLRRGLLSMLPNLAPILLTLGLMGWLDIPLDMSTTLIGGIIIGLAVDDTIHFMHRFNCYYEEGGDAQRAVRETLETTGTAMLFTSVVLGAGFLVFTLAYMQNVVVGFGLLCAFATGVAFLADVTLAPALMVLVTSGAAEKTLPTSPISLRVPTDFS
jgi:predicted RND superfamily exporter protein